MNSLLFLAHIFCSFCQIEVGERVQIDHMTATKNGVTCKHFQAWERCSKHIHAQVYSNATARSAKWFLQELVEITPYKILSIQVRDTTGNIDWAIMAVSGPPPTQRHCVMRQYKRHGKYQWKQCLWRFSQGRDGFDRVATSSWIAVASLHHWTWLGGLGPPSCIWTGVDMPVDHRRAFKHRAAARADLKQAIMNAG